jgi:hypothetical protein
MCSSSGSTTDSCQRGPQMPEAPRQSPSESRRRVRSSGSDPRPSVSTPRPPPPWGRRFPAGSARTRPPFQVNPGAEHANDHERRPSGIFEASTCSIPLRLALSACGSSVRNPLSRTRLAASEPAKRRAGGDHDGGHGRRAGRCELEDALLDWDPHDVRDDHWKISVVQSPPWSRISCARAGPPGWS